MAKSNTPTRSIKCLVCGRPASPSRRGLCQADYEKFRRARNKIPEDDWDAFESNLIDAGQLLPSRQGDRGVTGNVFAEALEEFLKSRKSQTDESQDLHELGEKVQKQTTTTTGKTRNTKDRTP